MKQAKRILAFALCLLMLNSNVISTTAFATVSGNDVVVETTAPIETEEVCEECGGSDAHTDTCSFNIVAPLNTEAPAETTQPTTAPTEATTETTQPTTTPTETTGETVSGNDVGCTECGEVEGHLETCSQYVAPTEETTEPTTAPTEEVTEPTACEHCGVELTEETVHTEECPLYEAPVVINVFADLMAAESVEAMYAQVLDIVNGDDADRREALMNLTYDELEELRARVNELDPEGDDTDTADMLDMLSALPNAECPDCGLIGEHKEDCPRYQVEVLLPNDGYIYFDLYYGNVTIKDGTYTGYVRGSNGTAQTISGTHSNSNNYYIFQSRGEAYPDDGSIPDYNRVTYNGQNWGDFITNHPTDSGNNTATNVDQVISAWGSVEHQATSATSGAAVVAGRQPTEHYIDIQTLTDGNIYNVVIDDLWSSYSLRMDPNSSGENWAASMNYVPAGFNFKLHSKNNTMNLKLVGDNRFGRVHCATHDGTNGIYHVDTGHTNKMTISTLSGKDDATLTVCNITANADHMYTAAAIGGTDGTDHTVKLELNQGTIYAGNAYGDFGSGIGGGGNGDGYVTINGGRVTAITSATGAAIGGGCGTSGPGGYGNVAITNGEVYAYNYKPCGTLGANYSDAMPTAIGGGSSGIQIGGLGIVNISGGKVYAYSQVGNAIGGGGGGRGYYVGSSGTESYYSTTGGIADVTISGGTVDAISGTGCAIGGGPGGGRGYTATNAAGLHTDVLKLYEDGKVSANGGTAKLTISGGTVRSGSIGGGSPLVLEDGTDYRDKYGFTVGAAVVNFSGGNIHGQVVMNGVIKANTDGFANNVHPTISGLVIGQNSSFTMTGGTIDNTPIGSEYRFVEENGGAVYINSGSAKMSGGEIRDASSPLGGAIYLQGGDFELSGTGLIQDCSATQLGGAVYVKGGDATVSGGTIQRCTAPSGGAAYVTGGNFTMSGGTIGSATEDDTNTAKNGAGVYVNGGQFTMSGGQMIGNKATENGGAAYITGGDFAMSGGTIGGEGAGEANTAINGAGVYVSGSATTGKFEMSGGSITANKATTHGGAAYVTGGNITMKGGTINKNTAINGAGVYVTGGQFDMISGSLLNNIAASHGGGAYVHGGNITIGVEKCKAEGENHDVTYPALKHPVVSGNDASFGGGLAADGGAINIYCGKIVSNTADNAGMGDNVFMYDQNTTDEDKPVLDHINGQVGDDKNHGMVVIGGDMSIPYEEGQLKITINYHDNGENLTFDVWVSEAPENYYLNLPYCPQNWETEQNKNQLTFVGWTYDTENTGPDVSDVVDLSFIRDKEDYKALGDPVMIRKVDWKEKNGAYYIDFYAVWAPLNNTVSYEVALDNYGTAQDTVKGMEPTMQGSNTTSYAFSQTVPATITLTNPSIPGYTFKGWKLTPSEDTISNWSVVSNAKDEAVTYPVDGTTSGTASLAGYGYEYKDGKFTLTTDRNFGDIKLTALFEEQNVDYTYILVGPKNANDFGTMTAKDASESYTTETVNKEYTVKIGKVTGNPGTATAEAAYGFKLKDLNGWFTDDTGSTAVDTTWVSKGTLTPAKVNGLYEGGTFYAVIEYHLADLIISKTATGSFSDDQTFIFEVYQGDKLLTTVALRSGESVTIKDLTIGTTYTVKEVDDWSWRFNDGGSKTWTMIPVAEGAKNTNEVTFANTQLINLWLTDDAFVLNKRKGSN